MTEAKIDRRKIRSQITRQKIITATIECYQQLGVENTFMEDVASQAGIGRATLYRHFKNQDEILTEVVLLEMTQLHEKLQFKTKHIQKLSDYIAEGCLYILRETPKKSVTPLLFQPGASSIISRLSMSNDHFILYGSDLMQPFYDKAKEQGLIRQGVSLAQIVEWTTRFLVSFMANPSHQFKTKKQQQHMINSFLLPSLMIVPEPD